MYEEKTPESIKAEILANLSTEIEKREGSFAADMAAPVALELWKLYDSLNAVLPIAFVDETSGEYIDKRCGDYGITRKSGRAVVDVTFDGQEGKTIPAGSVCVTDNGLEFITLAQCVVTEGTAKTGTEAAKVGAAYNVPAGAINRLLTPISGITGVTNLEAAAGGADLESDAALVERLYAYLRRPATSGNADHYRQWALETPGVGAAKIYPLWQGPGTVKVLIVDPEKGPVTGEVRQACADHIEENRPVGAAVTVASAEGLAVNVTATVVLNSSVTVSDVQEKFSAQLREYLKGVAFEKYELLYNRIVFLLLDIAGVENFTALTVNGGTENIEVGSDQVPVPGEVSISI